MKVKYLKNQDEQTLKQIKIGFIYDILMQGATKHTQVVGLVNEELVLLVEKGDDGETFMEAIEDVEEIIIEQKDDNLYFIIDGTKFKSMQLSKSRLDRIGYDDLDKEVLYYDEEVAKSVLSNTPKTFKVDLSELLTIEENDIIKENE